MLKDKNFKITTLQSIDVENDFIHSSINDSFMGENAFRIYLKQIENHRDFKKAFRVTCYKTFKGEQTDFSKNFKAKADSLLYYRTLVLENKDYIRNLAGI